MSTQKQVVTVRDLVDEAKKRIVIVVICVVGLSYLMSRKFWCSYSIETMNSCVSSVLVMEQILYLTYWLSSYLCVPL